MPPIQDRCHDVRRQQREAEQRAKVPPLDPLPWAISLIEA
jgi:hypothetical protein